MTRNTYALILAITVLGLFGADARGQEPTDQKEPVPRQALTFEISSSQVILPFLPPEATHVGYVHVKVDRDWEQLAFYDVSESTYWPKMSEAQRALVAKMDNLWLPREQRITGPLSEESDVVSTPTGMVTYRMIGVSEEDTKLMALALLERFDDNISQTRHYWSESRKSARRSVEKSKKRLPEARVEYDTASSTAQTKTKAFMQKLYHVPYDEDPQQAAKRLIEAYSYSLKLLDFELIGIEAKNKMIDRLSNSPKVTDRGAVSKLQELMVLNQVDLAGALARKAALETSVQEALEVYEVGKRLATLKREIAELERYLPDTIERAERPEPSDGWHVPVTIHENKVVIHPAKRGEGA